MRATAAYIPGSPTKSTDHGYGPGFRLEILEESMTSLANVLRVSLLSESQSQVLSP